LVGRDFGTRFGIVNEEDGKLLLWFELICFGEENVVNDASRFERLQSLMITHRGVEMLELGAVLIAIAKNRPWADQKKKDDEPMTSEGAQLGFEKHVFFLRAFSGK